LRIRATSAYLLVCIIAKARTGTRFTKYKAFVADF
jgi:hypothetical protein